jgi:hypothetical protein
VVVVCAPGGGLSVGLACVVRSQVGEALPFGVGGQGEEGAGKGGRGGCREGLSVEEIEK